MTRPTVVHVARDWVRPSEGFVRDIVRSTTATRAVVVCGRRWVDGPGGDVRVRTYELDRWIDRVVDRDAWDRRQRTRRGLVATIGALERASVLHAHFGYWAPVTAPAARRLGRPWAVSLHGHDLLVEARADPDQLAVLRQASLVVVPSRFLADAASDLGLDDARIRVIPAGVDLSELPFRERRPDPGDRVVVTFAGRFVEKKGVLDAARAMLEVRGRRPHLELRFVGFGPLEDELRRVLEPAGPAARIIDGSEPGAVIDALTTTHLVVTPSRTASDGDAETLGLVNLEAQACGVPVVTTQHGGIPEAVAEGGAVIVPEGDLRALRAALEQLVGAPDRWPAMGRAGRAHVALRFELGARAADLEEQYLALAHHRAPGPPPPRPREDWPTVSVVVPTYERRELLDRTLDALEAQTYPADRVEVIVADDGSTDGTVAELGNRQPPWRLATVRNDVNVSAAAARNRALAIAQGEVVAFTDDDCRPDPTWLEALVAGVRHGVDLVQGRTRPDASEPVRPLARTQWTPSETGLYETCNIAYTRAALDRVDGPVFRDELLRELRDLVGHRIGGLGFGEDTDLAWRVKALGGRSRFAPHATVQHHVFPTDPRYLLRRAWLSAGFPLLVREHPAFRTALWHRYLLSARRGRFLAAAAGVVLGAAADRRWLVFTLPYVSWAIRTGEAELTGHVKAVPALAVRDAVETVALVVGSARARRVVL